MVFLIFCVMLQEDINKLFEEHLCQNEEASKKRCENLLSTLSASMTEKLKKGFYARSGGYVLFSQDLEDIVKEYKIQANKGVRVSVNILHNCCNITGLRCFQFVSLSFSPRICVHRI